MEEVTYGMTNHPTLMFKRFLNNGGEQYYNAVQTVKADITEYFEEPDDRLNCMIEYLKDLYSSINKPAHDMPYFHTDVINYFKGQINFCEIAKEILDDS